VADPGAGRAASAASSDGATTGADEAPSFRGTAGAIETAARAVEGAAGAFRPSCDGGAARAS
jgi:hypothetical protein